MAIEAAFQNLADKFRAAREAFECLRLTAVEDRPLRNDVLLIERLGNAVDDLQGWLEEAAAAHVAVMESGAYGKILLNP